MARSRVLEVMTKLHRPQPQVETELTSVSSASEYESASEATGNSGKGKQSFSAKNLPPNTEESCSRRMFLQAGLSFSAGVGSRPLFSSAPDAKSSGRATRLNTLTLV